MIMKEKLNYFSSKNCNIVGMTTVKDIDNNEMLFALDDWGILNIYKLNCILWQLAGQNYTYFLYLQNFPKIFLLNNEEMLSLSSIA